MKTVPEFIYRFRECRFSVRQEIVDRRHFTPGILPGVIAMLFLWSIDVDNVLAQYPAHASFNSVSFRISGPPDLVPVGAFLRSDMTKSSPAERRNYVGPRGNAGGAGLVHEWPLDDNPSFVDAKGTIISTARIGQHVFKDIYDNGAFKEVRGNLTNYDVTAWHSSVQALGTARVKLDYKANPAEEDLVRIRVDVPAFTSTWNRDIVPNSGIDYLVQMWHMSADTRKLTAMDVKKGDEKVAFPIELKYVPNYPQPYSADFSADVGSLGTSGPKFAKGDQVYIQLTARVWAFGLDGKKPMFPEILAPGVIPEPATWILGLTGLAAVIATRVWKRRNTENPV